MKKSKFSESQIVKILQEAEGGIPVEELSRQHGLARPRFTNGKPSMAG
jgi:putative transposase